MCIRDRYYFSPSNGKSVRWSQKIGSYWYYFNGASQMQTGWVTWNADGAKDVYKRQLHELHDFSEPKHS